MKKIALLFVLTAAALSAQTFPGLKEVLSAAEWERAGLDKLTPDQLGVIDAALIRHQAGLQAQHTAEVAAVRQTTAVSPAPASVGTFSDTPESKGWMARFGLPTWHGPEWRTTPPLRGKVKAWAGGNRFQLENGQIWEGNEPITYDLPGKEIEIQARPHGQFALVVDGKNTTIRLIRLR